MGAFSSPAPFEQGWHDGKVDLLGREIPVIGLLRYEASGDLSLGFRGGELGPKTSADWSEIVGFLAGPGTTFAAVPT
jgi:hypothetical protein